MQHLGVDTDEALEQLAQIPISLHCWQGDDVGGFENPDQALGGGLMTTGNYPGKARTAVELRPGSGQGLQPDPRHPSPQPARHLPGERQQKYRATRSSRSISPAGSPGPKKTTTASTSTPPSSRIPWPTTASRSPIATRASATSGSSIASPAAKSAPISAGNWARRRSPISGFPTA